MCTCSGGQTEREGDIQDLISTYCEVAELGRRASPEMLSDLRRRASLFEAENRELILDLVGRGLRTGEGRGVLQALSAGAAEGWGRSLLKCWSKQRRRC